jgi:hypothetical protein
MVGLNFAHRARLGPSASTCKGKPSRGGDQPVANSVLERVAVLNPPGGDYCCGRLWRMSEPQPSSANVRRRACRADLTLFAISSQSGASPSSGDRSERLLPHERRFDRRQRGNPRTGAIATRRYRGCYRDDRRSSVYLATSPRVRSYTAARESAVNRIQHRPPHPRLQADGAARRR